MAFGGPPSEASCIIFCPHFQTIIPRHELVHNNDWDILGLSEPKSGIQPGIIWHACGETVTDTTPKIYVSITCRKIQISSIEGSGNC